MNKISMHSIIKLNLLIAKLIELHINKNKYKNIQKKRLDNRFI